MAKVTVKVYTILKDKLGFSSIEISGKNLGEVISKLVKVKDAKDILLDKEGKIKGHFVVTINSEIIDNKKFENIKLHDGDIINIFPPVSGG